jgi:hypothetical protein
VTSNAHVNNLIDRATSDLRMLLTEEEGILYPYAGIPWFCTPFGLAGRRCDSDLINLENVYAMAYVF